MLQWRLYSESLTHNFVMSTNKNNRFSIICYCNPFLVYRQHKHTTPATCPPTASLRVLHTLPRTFHPRHAGKACHEGNMDHSIAFTFTPFQRLRTAMEPSLIPLMPLTTTPTSSRCWRTLRTNATSFIVLTVPTVSLPLWILLHTSFHPHAVEEQDARQCQQQEADRATYTGVVNSACILTCRISAMKQESQTWEIKPSYRNWNTGEEWTHQILQNGMNSRIGEGITVKIVRRQEIKQYYIRIVYQQFHKSRSWSKYQIKAQETEHVVRNTMERIQTFQSVVME